MDYSNWKESKMPVAKLLLDELNPRIPSAGKKLSQNEIIKELVENDKVYELAESITANGYMPDQYLIAYKDDGKTIVVEGNRRLASCKLLLDPTISPPAFKRRFTLLSEKKDSSDISSVKIFLAPSREATIPFVVSKHTESTLEPWGPIMKANFYARQIKEGVSIEKLSGTINVSVADIKKALFTAKIYESVTKLKLSTETAEVVKDPRRFSITTLGRILDRPVGRTFLGIKQDTKGNIKFDVPKKELSKKLGRIASDIASWSRNSRNLNKDEQIKDYFDEIDGITKVVAPTKKPAIKKLGIKGLLPSSINCELDSDRVKEIVIELQKIHVKEFPNATAVLLRVLLELSTYKYMSELKEIEPWKKEVASKGHLRDTFPTLTEMLLRVVNKNLISDNQIKKALKIFVDKNAKDPMIEEFNQYIHNFAYIPSEGEIRAHSKKLLEYFKIIFKKIN
jgi:hypothetical protein